MSTDTSEKGLESLIIAHMTSAAAPVPADQRIGIAGESPIPYGEQWTLGNAADYARDYAIDVAHLSAFLQATQPDLAESFDLTNASPTRHKFLSRLQGEITKRGTIDVLRNGIKHGPHSVDTFYGTPSDGNLPAAARYCQNRFSIAR